MSDSLLMMTLEVAVPMWVEQVKLWPFEKRAARSRELTDIVASKGDVILFKSKKKGESADAFNALAEGLALLSLQPGGVTFNGRHWEAQAA